MTRDNQIQDELAHKLSQPDDEVADLVQSEMGWENRLEANIRAASMGLMTQRVYSLQEVYNLMSTTEAFVVDFSKLESWTSEVIGDEELGAAIGDVKDSDNSREKVTELIRLRLNQVAELEN